jgi:aminoglycoside phosphotransferase
MKPIIPLQADLSALLAGAHSCKDAIGCSGSSRGEGLARLFIEEYGLEHIDEDKIAYFIPLDEHF